MSRSPGVTMAGRFIRLAAGWDIFEIVNAKSYNVIL